MIEYLLTIVFCFILLIFMVKNYEGSLFDNVVFSLLLIPFIPIVLGLALIAYIFEVQGD